MPKLSPEFIEGIKQTLRVALIAVIPVLISELQANNVDFRVLAVTFFVAVLSGIDKFLHEMESKNPVTKFLELENL